MIEGISAGLSSLNAAMNLAKALNSANTQAAINEIKLDLQERIFEARDALNTAREVQAMSLERVRELEQEIMRLKDWEAEKQRYELCDIDGRAFAYMAKAGMEGGEPPHWLCEKCFRKGQPSALQFQKTVTPGVGHAYSIYRCNECKGEIGVHFLTVPHWKRLVG